MHSPLPDIDTYSRELLPELYRALRRTSRQADVDDAVQEAAARFLRDPRAVMESYPEPADFARATAKHSWIGHSRRQAAQRGEGWLGGREVRCGSEWSMEVPSSDSFESQVECRLEAVRVLKAASGQEGALLFMVHGLDYEVQEIAEVVGVRRETVSRRLKQAREHVRVTNRDSSLS